MNQKRVEMLSIQYLKEELLNSSNRIEALISENDKEPSYDGQILLYKDSSLKKEGLKKIPVQVKGSCRKKSFSHKSSIKFPVSKIDLQNYKNHNGVLYLVVYLNENGDYKIFYKDLLPADIDKIIKKMKAQKKKSLEFYPFDKIVSILEVFHTNQSNSNANSKYLDTLDNSNINSIVFNSTNPFDKSFFDKSIVLYGISKNLPKILIPLIRVIPTETSLSIPCTVSINRYTYYETTKLVSQKDCYIVKIGNAFEIKIPHDSDSINFSAEFKGSFKHRIEDLPFIKALIENETFNINDSCYPFELGSKDSTYFKNEIEFLEKIQQLYTTLNIQKDLDLNSISNNDLEKLSGLIDYFVNNNQNALKVNNFQSNGFGETYIGNLYFKFIATKTEGDKICVYDIFDNTLDFKAEFDELIVPPYISFSVEDLSNLCNLDIDSIYEELINFKATDDSKYLDALNFFLLKMIDSFDQTSDFKMMDNCEKLSIFLLDKKPEDLFFKINKYQIDLRLGDKKYPQKILKDILPTKDIISLETEINDHSAKELLLPALSLLNGEKEKAEYYIGNLDSEKKLEFESFPIYNLYRKL